MKYFSLFALCLALFTNNLQSEEFQFGDYIPDKLAVDESHVYVISTFDQIHYLTAYQHSGDMAWEVNFTAKIISCEFEQGTLFVFSKARNGAAYFLTCINLEDGKMLWEKAIWAPQKTDS